MMLNGPQWDIYIYVTMSVLDWSYDRPRGRSMKLFFSISRAYQINAALVERVSPCSKVCQHHWSRGSFGSDTVHMYVCLTWVNWMKENKQTDNEKEIEGAASKREGERRSEGGMKKHRDKCSKLTKLQHHKYWPTSDRHTHTTWLCETVKNWQCFESRASKWHQLWFCEPEWTTISIYIFIHTINCRIAYPNIIGDCRLWFMEL